MFATRIVRAGSPARPALTPPKHVARSKETRMFRKLKLLLFAGLIVLLLPTSARAQENPFQIALLGPPLQLVSDAESINGVRINLLYGVNRNVAGFDLGVINRIDQDLAGIQLGLVGFTDRHGKWWQANAINFTRENFTGAQTGLVNLSGSGEGLQLGPLFNRTGEFSGLQMGLVNVADDLYGIQVGLLNIIRSKERFPFFPIVNWKFD
jgi:hypothetical protein